MSYLYFVPDEPAQPAPYLNTVDYGSDTLNALADALHGAFPLSSRYEYTKLKKLTTTSEHVLKHALRLIVAQQEQHVFPHALAGDIFMMLRYMDVNKDHLRPLLILLYPELAD